ncbi:MAG: hypothetical protein DMD48_12570 [Gemmatimonadetes bacterium]|nr:MAG: hypothetical protein DMD48_12570 [Gemmatimonadota bacterium]
MKPLRVAVIGAGTMGHGIAYVAALAGCEVRLTDARADALPQALDRIEALLVSGVKRGKLATDDHAAVRKRILAESQMRVAVSDADHRADRRGDDAAGAPRWHAFLQSGSHHEAGRGRDPWP